MQKQQKQQQKHKNSKTRKAELAWKLQARSLQACKAASLKISKLEEIKREDAAPPRQMHQVHCRPYRIEACKTANFKKFNVNFSMTLDWCGWHKGSSTE